MIVTNRVYDCRTKTYYDLDVEIPDEVVNQAELEPTPEERIPEPKQTPEERIAALEEQLAAAKILLGVE